MRQIQRDEYSHHFDFFTFVGIMLYAINLNVVSLFADLSFFNLATQNYIYVVFLCNLLI